MLPNSPPIQGEGQNWGENRRAPHLGLRPLLPFRGGEHAPQLPSHPREGQNWGENRREKFTGPHYI